MKIHTTKGGDKFLRNHMIESNWIRDAYRPPSRPLPGDKVSRVMTMFVALAGVIGLLAIVTFLSK